MTESARLLVVDDEEIARSNLERVLGRSGYSVATAASGDEALRLLEAGAFDVALTDLSMAGVDGMQVLGRVRERGLDTEVVVVTAHGSAETAVEAMRRGAFYYIAKPFRLDEVRKVVAEAVEKVRLKRENRALRDTLDEYRGRVRIVTQDARMLRLLETARQVAPTDCNVLVLGATGTGKELLARYLHEHSARAGGPYLAINCGAFGEELLANELFGHEKGAYTGAHAARRGLLEAAAGGTLFLDEVTEMSPAMQVKLLRVLQEREVLRVGGTAPIPIDVRFVAATNRALDQAVASGAFRQDLYYRLNVVALELPPLSARPDDVPMLASHFVRRYAALMQKEVREISREALDRLAAWPFPGNVRELENVVERAVALARGTQIALEDLPEAIRDAAGRPRWRRGSAIVPLDQVERDYIEWVLREAGGNQTQAAELLGIDRVSLWRKLKRYGREPAAGVVRPEAG